jgi:DNA repair exonuclease SbcCD nuclease subunit
MPVVLADLHLGKVQDTIDKEGMPSRIYDCIARCKEVVDYAAKKNEHLIFAGDIYHTSNPAPEVVKAFFEILKYASHELNQSVIIIPGNHDWTLKYNSLIYTDMISDKVVVIREPCVYEMNGLNVAFLPHMNISDYMEYATSAISKIFKKSNKSSKVNKVKIDLVIGHGNLEGAVNTSGNEVESGNAINLKMSEFWPYKVGVFGHIHQYQKVGSKNYYTGPVVTNSFDEADVKKGFIHINNKCEVEFIPFKTKEETYKTINLKVYGELKLDETKVSKKVGGCLVRINITTDDITKVPKQYIENTFNKYCKVMQTNITIDRKEAASIALSDIECAKVIKKSDYNSIFKKYVVSKKLPKAESELIVKLGTALIKEVSSAARN